MPPPSTPSTSSTKPRLPSKGSMAPPSATTGRVTRLRAAKESTASPAIVGGSGAKTPSGLLAKGKEGLRKVSDKIAQKDRETSAVKPKTTSSSDSSSYSECLQAYLRIRPSPGDSDPNAVARPYLEVQSETDVLMRAPAESARHHMPKPPHIFSFNRVFAPSTPQSSFFTTTTLPLVEKLLQGENALLFAYGVSNSGKSYTIQGGNTTSASERGVLPRAIDVVFNSINGLESNVNLKPQGLADVVFAAQPDEPINLVGPLAETEPRISDIIKVDRNFSYAVFVSYAEIFDLLDSVLPTTPSTPSQSRSRTTYNGLPRASHMGFPSALNSSFNLAAMANGGGGILKRQALALKNDPEGNGKYIAGLKDVRVRTREEALAVFRSGQSARQVFGTIANRESSRSHGIFTIKVVRIHNGAPEDPDSAQVSRLAIVDLAGSERTRNTQTTGERLKEAGNINKSLMVLGQCLEVLRANQQKMAAPAAAGVKKKLAVVPFRHSKLTEVFQNFFVGDGRAVIIVNVNPYDTGFDENSHVMRFSAIAREIQTTASNKVGFPLLKRQISTQFSAFKHAVSGPMKIKVVVPVLPKTEEVEMDKGGAKVAADRESQGFVMVEEELEVVEEDEDSDSEDERDPLVDHLFEQLKEMKTRLYESEMRNASIEVEIREEVARDMQEALQKMHDDFAKRLHEQVTANELKTDRKIDIVTRTMTPAVHRMAQFRGTPASSSRTGDTSQNDISIDESFESAIEASLMTSGDDSMVSTESDPFIVRSTQTIPQVIITRESLDFVKKQSTPIRLEDADEETSREEIALAPEVDDDDDEALEPVAEVLSSEEEDLSTSTEDEEEDEDEDTEQEDGDEDEEDIEEDAEEVDIDSDASAFTLSEEEVDDPSSDESSPVKKAASRRRTTGSPTKSRASAKPRTPVVAKVKPVEKTPATSAKKKAATTPAKKKAATTPAKNSLEISQVRTPGPLSERVGQMQLDDEDEDELPVKTTTKKKRTLGKKVVTEDEMNNADAKISGAEVRRLVRGGV
ncbi:hypothetical protein IAR55_003672 [Kwoniella newhampshirensis]|uniref:Kinesin motor domain-containing protein n=1 Tax=Kwoniella newhampshirensis TaxID=1651941 RepID=A0AAW0YZ67_9TREE